MAGLQFVTSVMNGLNVPILQAGNDADKPAFGIPGRFYYAIDTSIIYQDNGTAWIIFLQGSGGGAPVTNGNNGLSLNGNTLQLGGSNITQGNVNIGLGDSTKFRFLNDVNAAHPIEYFVFEAAGTSVSLFLNSTSGGSNFSLSIDTILSWAITSGAVNYFSLQNDNVSNLSFSIAQIGGASNAYIINASTTFFGWNMYHYNGTALLDLNVSPTDYQFTLRDYNNVPTFQFTRNSTNETTFQLFGSAFNTLFKLQDNPATNSIFEVSNTLVPGAALQFNFSTVNSTFNLQGISNFNMFRVEQDTGTKITEMSVVDTAGNTIFDVLKNNTGVPIFKLTIPDLADASGKTPLIPDNTGLITQKNLVVAGNNTLTTDGVTFSFPIAVSVPAGFSFTHVFIQYTNLTPTGTAVPCFVTNITPSGFDLNFGTTIIAGVTISFDYLLY